LTITFQPQTQEDHSRTPNIRIFA